MGEPINSFEDLECWQEARTIVNCVYRVCSVGAFKRDYSLIDQMKRAAISIMANIAEGFSRRGNKEFIQFLFIAKSSAAELQSHLYVTLDQGYINRSTFDEIYQEADKVQRQISNFIKYLNLTLRAPSMVKPTAPRTLKTQ
jgi:four helix bundle protein